MRAYEEVRVERTVPAGAVGGTFLVGCPTGKMPINGGALPTPPMKVVGGSLTQIQYVNGVRTGTWGVAVDNTGGPQRDVTLFAVCAKVD
jgi:hypothetical protein